MVKTNNSLLSNISTSKEEVDNTKLVQSTHKHIIIESAQYCLYSLINTMECKLKKWS